MVGNMCMKALAPHGRRKEQRLSGVWNRSWSLPCYKASDPLPCFRRWHAHAHARRGWNQDPGDVWAVPLTILHHQHLSCPHPQPLLCPLFLLPTPTPATGACLLGLPSNHLTTQIHDLLHLLLKPPFAVENKKRDPKSGSCPLNALTTVGLGFCLYCQRNSERFLEAGSDYQELFERSPLCCFKENESKSQRTLKTCFVFLKV